MFYISSIYSRKVSAGQNSARLKKDDDKVGDDDDIGNEDVGSGWDCNCSVVIRMVRCITKQIIPTEKESCR